MHSRDLKSGLLFLIISLIVLYESLRIGLGALSKPGSGFLTFCAGIVLMGLSFYMIHRGWSVREARITHSRKVILALGVLIVYSFVLDALGFIVATFLAVAALFGLQTSRPWWAILGISALVTLLAYLVFGILLQVFFPPGFLGI
jgi:putative tricarboxylic transport membrane protein